MDLAHGADGIVLSAHSHVARIGRGTAISIGGLLVVKIVTIPGNRVPKLY